MAQSDEAEARAFVDSHKKEQLKWARKLLAEIGETSTIALVMAMRESMLFNRERFIFEARRLQLQLLEEAAGKQAKKYRGVADRLLQRYLTATDPEDIRRFWLGFKRAEKKGDAAWAETMRLFDQRMKLYDEERSR